MAHNGFVPYSHPDFIKELRQLLQDKYTWDGNGFTILKKLIQNANDAGATRFDIGWASSLLAAGNPIPGEPASERRGPVHPLLTVPAIFAVNNGPFSDDEKRL